MRNIDNALSDVVELYKFDTIRYDIIKANYEENVWIVNVYNTNAPESLLKIEIIDNNGQPACCVLERTNVGRRSMFKFMNRLVNSLQDN